MPAASGEGRRSEPVPEPPPWRPSGWLMWVVVGIAASAGTLLNELSELLSEISSTGSVSYSASVFTSFTVSPGSAAQNLADAVRLWCPAGPPSPSSHCYLDYVYGHLAIDLFLFTPAYTLLLYIVMRLVGLRAKGAALIALTVLVLDTVETATTWVVVAMRADALFFVARSFSLIKWIAIAAAALVIVGAWASRRVTGELSLQRERGQDPNQPAPSRKTAAKLAGPLTAVAVFLGLVALPAGGPLDQIPDVLRAQVSAVAGSPVNVGPLLGSLFGLGLFFLAVLVAGMWTVQRPNKVRPAPTTCPILIGATLFAVLVWVVKCWMNEPEPWAGVPLLGVVLTLSAVDLAVRRLSLRDDDTDRPSSLATTEQVTEAAKGWVAALPAIAVVGSGLGLLRASFRPLVLGIAPKAPWVAGTAVAVVVVVVMGLLTDMICRRMLGHEVVRRVLAVVVVVLLVPIAAALAFVPEWAVYLTSTGTLAVCLGVIALLVGGLHWLSQRSEPWPVTQRLRLGGIRTPIVGMLTVTWLLAGVVNTAGGYHDIRVFPGVHDATYATPTAAFDAWLASVGRNPSCVSTTRSGTPVVRLVMIAAPGGGIRASYWTAAGLDAITKSTPCGATNVFAVSGVSGGSIGTAAWMASAPGQARAAVRTLAGDNALAAATASLFLRDAPQPLLGAGRWWRDRSAVMEDQWTFPGSPFGTADHAQRFTDLARVETRPSADWTPAVMLNGSSVTNGCRVIVTNVATLPIAPSACEPDGEGGVLTGALDAMADLHTDLGTDGASCDFAGRGDMRLATAALLSARFPVISSSGVFDRCVAPAPGGDDQSRRVVTTYDVDGGYYENSGLLSLLEFWGAIRPTVESCNQLSAQPPPTVIAQPRPTATEQTVSASASCPETWRKAPPGLQIQPWIVVLDNHYQSAAVPAPAARQFELTAPLTALLNAGTVIDQDNLEAAAAQSMTGFSLRGNGGKPEGAGQYIRIGPTLHPTLQAPLGWVLSQASRCALGHQLRDNDQRVPILDTANVGSDPDCADAAD